MYLQTQTVVIDGRYWGQRVAVIGDEVVMILFDDLFTVSSEVVTRRVGRVEGTNRENKKMTRKRVVQEGNNEARGRSD